MRPCWIRPTSRATAVGAAHDRQVEPVPEVIVDRDRVARLRVERRRQVALHPEERLEDLADRLAEALGRVLHARRLQRKAAVPRRRAAHAAVIAADARPASSAARRRRSPRARSAGCSSSGRRSIGASSSQFDSPLRPTVVASSSALTGSISVITVTGKMPSSTQPTASQTSATRSQTARRRCA